MERDEEGRAIDTGRISRIAARAALERKAEDLVVLDVKGRASYCDAFVICSGSNPRQVRAIAEAVVRAWKEESGGPPLGVEGLSSARWVLVDLGQVLVHVFERSVRDYYDLDGLWIDAPRVPLEDLGLAELAEAASPEGPRLGAPPG